MKNKKRNERMPARPATIPKLKDTAATLTPMKPLSPENGFSLHYNKTNSPGVLFYSLLHKEDMNDR